MPLDAFFTSTPKVTRQRELIESDAKLLGRLDRRAGDFKCPFPKDSGDAAEWTEGHQAEEESWGPD